MVLSTDVLTCSWESEAALMSSEQSGQHSPLPQTTFPVILPTCLTYFLPDAPV